MSDNAQDTRCVLCAFHPDHPFRRRRTRTTDAHCRLHCIVFRPRNAVDTEADIALDLLGYDAFEKALKAMGIEDDDSRPACKGVGLFANDPAPPPL